MSRIDILKKSLENKKKLFDEKLDQHFKTVKQANGQPLNDKRGGRSTLKKWETQDNALRRLNDEIEKTKTALENEIYKTENADSVKDTMPEPIIEMLNSGELTQWKNFPNFFFVVGVEKARIQFKDGVLSHRYYKDIPDKEQRIIFAKCFNELNAKIGVRNE